MIGHLFCWFRQRRAARLMERVVVIEARITAERELERLTGTFHPSKRIASAEELALIKHRLMNLELSIGNWIWR